MDTHWVYSWAKVLNFIHGQKVALRHSQHKLVSLEFSAEIFSREFILVWSHGGLLHSGKCQLKRSKTMDQDVVAIPLWGLLKKKKEMTRKVHGLVNGWLVGKGSVLQVAMRLSNEDPAMMR